MPQPREAGVERLSESWGDISFSTSFQKQATNSLVAGEDCEIWCPWLQKEVITAMHTETDGVAVFTTGFDSYIRRWNSFYNIVIFH